MWDTESPRPVDPVETIGDPHPDDTLSLFNQTVYAGALLYTHINHDRPDDAKVPFLFYTNLFLSKIKPDIRTLDLFQDVRDGLTDGLVAFAEKPDMERVLQTAGSLKNGRFRQPVYNVF